MHLAQFQLHSQIELRHWWFTARRRILRDLITQVVPACSDTIVVDVGCGTGGNIGDLSDTFTCVGIDPSADAIRLARSRFPRVEFICGRAPQDLGQWAARADLFLIADVLEHVADDFALLSAVMAAARPGSYFLLTVPADLSLWSPHDESLGHYRRYDLDRFQRIWQGLPVSELLLSHFNCRLYPVVKWLRTINRWRHRSGGLAGTDLKTPSAPVNWILKRIFQGERKLLVNLLHGRRRQGYASGVSLIALLRRGQGVILPRSKPDDMAPDYYQPPEDEPADAMPRACCLVPSPSGKG
jgi:SAM-dependent methyltransferase